MQHHDAEGSSPWSREVLRCGTKASFFQRETIAFFRDRYTEVSNHAGR
jgi:hypothetical protein